ncbi:MULTISPECIES: helix-turn-helix domain-containing protein [unclassified Caballeronia]|uniref:helix-turn-helix domain-containing protein n=1 Tax=unclassified Caballeronia TaxID=2646786 RepID=UPI00285EC6BF|nr:MULTISPECIES: helix-turn-helix domain-containing protein [unclassified Caballeronia]MDR5775319.1 helix-turn-helix domain-containing protein [Caballeronia sp. LZ002]MDR5850757.1 helix-turn-helix domain-containing protein [Caballeronia sp. LZ003]
MSDDIDPILVAVLAQLWRARRESPEKPWSLAKLAKQSDLPMSALRRQLTGLADAGLIEMSITEEGAGSAWLSAEGVTLCAAVFGAEG